MMLYLLLSIKENLARNAGDCISEYFMQVVYIPYTNCQVSSIPQQLRQLHPL